MSYFDNKKKKKIKTASKWSGAHLQTLAARSASALAPTCPVVATWGLGCQGHVVPRTWREGSRALDAILVLSL